jgi:Fe-S cluster assembly protein SufD
MSDLLSFYQQQANTRFSDLPWLSHIQKNALADFVRLGFPTRHDEDWKYTPVEPFLQQAFVNNVQGKIKRFEPVPIEDSIIITNGIIEEGVGADLHKGVIIQPLAQAFIDHADKIKPYLNHILQHEHGFQALNTAMLQQGLFIYLPKDVSLSRPLLLNHWQDKAEQASYLRHLVILEQGSSASIIEDYHGDADTCYFTNTITEVYLAAEATLQHCKIQRESKLAYHIGHLAVKQAANSRFESHSFSRGGRLVRSDIAISLDEPLAQCLMNGIYQPSDQQHMDHHTVVRHVAPDCSSEQDYKGILNGHARAVFNGRVVVVKNAQHTEAKQQNKNLLLSANTEVNTKPQLEIFADDVVCTHGATVGQLDEDALFYLATRGINREEASRYLVQAFTAENLRMLGHKELAEWIGVWLGM